MGVTDRSQGILDRTVEADNGDQAHALAAAANLSLNGTEPRRARHDDIPTSTNPGVPRKTEDDDGGDGLDGDVESMSGESIPRAALETTLYAGNAARILDMNDALRECGLEEFFSLPKVAVIGNQSSGKSSLIEAISQIKVPRDDKRCTKCPIELRLRSGKMQWKCDVSLKLDYDVPDRLKGTIYHFASTASRPRVESILKYAQWSVLNAGIDNHPLRTYEELLNADPPVDLNQTSGPNFSRNVVLVKIEGGPINVDFVDLPGIIVADESESGDSQVIQLVQNLSATFLDDPQCLSLLTIDMNVDIETQSAYALARKHDQDGNRRIGVLTKADAMQQGTEGKWLNILNGLSYRATHGYYVTRLMSPEERSQKMSWSLSRTEERNFFNNTFWRTVHNQERLGTKNLAAALSDQLCRMIVKSLPEAIAYVNGALDETTALLRALPAPPTDNPEREMRSLCTTYLSEIERYTQCHEHHQQIYQFWRQISEDLICGISETRPRFDITLGTECRHRNINGEITSNDNRPQRQAVLDLSARPIPLDGPVTLGELTRIIRDTRVRELHGIIPWAAYDHLIRPSICKWLDKCLRSFEQVLDILKQLVTQITEIHFARFTASGLKEAVRTESFAILNATAEHTRRLIEWYCGWELRRPWTQRNVDLITNKAKFMTEYSQTLSHEAANRRCGHQPHCQLGQHPPSPPSSLPAECPENTSSQPATGSTTRHRHNFQQRPAESSSQPAPCSTDPFRRFQPADQHQAQPPVQHATPPAGKRAQASASPSSGQVFLRHSFVQPNAEIQPKTIPQSQSQPQLDAQGQGQPQPPPPPQTNHAVSGLQAGNSGEASVLSVLDEYGEEIALAATVSAYFQVAAERVIDVVPMIIENELVRTFSDILFEQLEGNLDVIGPNGAKKCADYITEDPATRRERQELQRRIRILMEAKEKLRNMTIDI